MIGVFITARLGSTRLSEKHLIVVKEKPFIKWLVARFSVAFKKQIDNKELKIFVTTSLKPENKKFELIFDKEDVEVFFGSDDNIPLRHLECANENNVDYIISLDGDDILCSTEASKLVAVKLLKGSKIVQTAGLPLGMNITGYSKDFLRKSLLRIENNKLETGWGKIFDKNEIDIIQLRKCENSQKIRMTLDYQADADFFTKVISNLDVINVSDDYLIENILRNDWNQINNHLDDIYWSNFNLQKQEEHLKLREMRDNYSQKLHELIPGGAHTYSRGDDQFPYNAPSILERGEAAYVYDPQGNRYLDYGMGLRSVNIGYGNKEIADACYNEIIKGNNLSRASLTELDAAQLLVDLIPSVEMVKFAKHGSTVTTAAVKLARAYTNRKYIAIPFEQPFFSFDDWFIGSTVLTRGTLEETSCFTLKFHYNDISSLNDLFDKYKGQIAGVMLEAATTLKPCGGSCNIDMICKDCPNNKHNFLHQVQDSCKNNGAVFILDEMITGFRWHMQGAQTYYNIQPDLCTFGKAMANGQAVAALGGKTEIMKLGGILEEAKERVFLTSTTHGAEMSALGAFMKTVEIMKRDNVIKHYWDYGNKLISGMNQIAINLHIQDFFYVEGYPCSPNYITKNEEGAISLAFRTLFAQSMLDKKVLMPYIAVSYAHQEEELKVTLNAVQYALEIYKLALENGFENYLKSDIIKPVFRKYN